MVLGTYFALEAPLDLLILEADVRFPVNAPTTLFGGQVSKPKATGKQIEATARAFGNTFDGKFPRVLMAPGCSKISPSRAR